MLACFLITRTCLKTTRGLISGTFRWLTLEVLSPEKNCSLIWKLFKFLMTLLAGLFEMRGCWHIGLRWAIIALWATCIYTLRATKYIVGKKTKILWLIFAFFFHFSFFPSLTPVCVKDFSGTTAPRILKFGTNAGYDFLYCVKENQSATAYHCLSCQFLFLSQQILLQILSFCESQSLQILYKHWEWPSILWDRKQNLYLYCLLSPFFHLSLQCNT